MPSKSRVEIYKSRDGETIRVYVGDSFGSKSVLIPVAEWSYALSNVKDFPNKRDNQPLHDTEDDCA